MPLYWFSSAFGVFHIFLTSLMLYLYVGTPISNQIRNEANSNAIYEYFKQDAPTSSRIMCLIISNRRKSRQESTRIVADRPRDRSIGASGELGISQPPFSGPDLTAIHICHSKSWVLAVLSPRLRAALAMSSPGNAPPICHHSTSVHETETAVRSTSAIAIGPNIPIQGCHISCIMPIEPYTDKDYHLATPPSSSPPT